MVYVTALEMKEIDRAAIERYGVPAARLMEKAGMALADEAAAVGGAGHILVVCGYGNNGGDGFVAARHLIKKGFGVSVLLAGRPRPFSNETGDNFKALLESGCNPSAIYDSPGMERAFSALPACGAVVDALFGIGIKGPLDVFYVSLIEKINSLGPKVVSADLPSGLDADEGTPCPVAVKAFRTVTFGMPKEAFRNASATLYTGDVVVADIGLPPEAVDDVLRKAGRNGG